MRLHHLEVSGFRGFATKQEFDLSADATIIVGSNGLGKTSLLDAVQWGLSGRLGRLGKGDENVLSLYAETGQARVSLSLLNDNDSIRITRAFDGESQNVSAYVNEKELRGASARHAYSKHYGPMQEIRMTEKNLFQWHSHVRFIYNKTD